MTATSINILQCQSKLETLAGGLKKRHELGIEVQELCQAGYVELQRLALSGKYDPARGDFWKWAKKYVVKAMIEEVGRYAGRSRRQQAAVRANDRARECASAHPTADARERFMKRWSVVDGTAVGYQLDLVADEESLSPEDHLLETERERLDAKAVERLLASIQRLPERQRNMFLQVIVDETKPTVVAVHHKISKSRVSHNLRKTRKRLRLAMELESEP